MAKEATKWYRQGCKFYNKKDYEEAIRCYGEAIKLNPNNAVYWGNKGLAFNDKENYEEAIKCFNEAIKLNRKNADYWNQKGLALNGKENYEEAIKCFREAIKLNSNNADYWNNMGNVLYGKENYKEAIKCFNEAIKLNPNNADYWHYKGLVLKDKESYEEAIKCYEEALKLNPKNADYWNQKGNVLYAKKNYEEAIKCFDEAIKLVPKYADDCWDNKGNAFFNKENYEEAIKCYDEAIKLNPENAVYWNHKGLALNGKERYEEAIKCFDEIIKLNPKNADYWNHRGLALNGKENYEEAIKCFDEAIKLVPTDADYWNNKGMTFDSKGDYDGAIKCYNTAIEINNIFTQKIKPASILPNQPKPILHLHNFLSAVPNEFKCPISREVMRDPVCAADGYSYEREEIKKWLSSNPVGISPLTNNKLSHNYLCQNLYLKQNIKKFLESHPQVPETQLIIDLENGELTSEKIQKDIWLGAKIDSADEHGNTALHLAIQHGDQKMFQLLLDAGASAARSNHNGQTPLHLSCRKGHLPITEKLLMFHPNLSLKDKFGKMALDYAKEEKHRDIGRLLAQFEKEQEKMEIEEERKSPELHWAQNLTLFYKRNMYGEGKEKFAIPADNHKHLRGFVKNAEENDMRENTNFAAMQLGFFYTLIEEKKNGGPYLNFYSLDVDKHKEKYFHVSIEYLYTEEFFEDLKRYHPTRSQDIEKFFKLKNEGKGKGFFQLFHHSERSLFKHLETLEHLTNYVNEFANYVKTKHGQVPSGCRVKMVVLDIHSTHYLCNWCEPALQYFQSNDSLFYKLLKGALMQLGFEVSQNFYITSRYTAEKPAAQQKIKKHTDHKLPHEILDIEAYRKKRIPLILERDDNETIGDYKSVSIATSKRPADGKMGNPVKKLKK